MARSEAKAKKAAEEIMDISENRNAQVEGMECDLTSLRSIKAFSDRFYKKNIPLHMLLNNAGTFLPPYDFTEDGFEVTVGTNYFGTFYLTHLLMDKLKQTAPSRIVFQASLFEHLGHIDWKDLECKRSQESGVFEYATSKLEVIMLARELNKRLQGSGVECFISQPGLAHTPLYRKSDHKKLSTWLVDAAQWVYGQRAPQACLSLLFAATEPSLQGKGGSYYGPPFVYLAAIHIPFVTGWNTGQREPGNVYTRDQVAWKHLYDETTNLINGKLKEKNIASPLPVVDQILIK
ncbi:hypothetical protein WJX72_010208 [[Myrmecia] bisecta]|uniref:Uncharacterized protein n=1 Tax=[Myrmecia] bisecta TaxID=41462 RepID=A0AAW1Q119_9CHLO